jgi:hypothetical protein
MTFTSRARTLPLAGLVLAASSLAACNLPGGSPPPQLRVSTDGSIACEADNAVFACFGSLTITVENLGAAATTAIPVVTVVADDGSAVPVPGTLEPCTAVLGASGNPNDSCVVQVTLKGSSQSVVASGTVTATAGAASGTTAYSLTSG